MDKITIVVPCYNVEDKIKRCICSIKEQSYHNFIVFLVDDGSTDNTADVIKNEIKNDHRFIYLYKQNGGQATARNLGIDKCDTEYITFIDSDDYIKIDYLKVLMAGFSSEIDLVAGYFERVYENKTSVNTFTVEDLNFSKYPAVWGKVFRTSIIDEFNIRFSEGLWYEDLCFFTIFMEHSREIEIAKDSLYYYMQNPNSTMYTFSNKIYDMYPIMEILEDNVSNKERLEYIVIYHVLIGTIFRTSFKKDFSKKELIEICRWVELKYPKWYENVNIKSQMTFFYKFYLWFLKKKQYQIVFILLTKCNKFLSL